ncbi:MAG: RsmD family RNA methyltransferase [Taibaiella sp.]|nr:RsmD family RNA methyltransferase [Taibaiella sp.]
MRIISGAFGGRRFNPPAGIPARPTTELAREGLFNMLHNSIELEGNRTLDLFGGTGSVSYELASRGAAELTIVERDATTFDFIKKTVGDLGITDRTRLVKGDVFKYMKHCTEQFDFIFADPPYALAEIDSIPMIVFERNLLLPGGLFVMEHATSNDYQRHPAFVRMKNYGTTAFTFFKLKEEGKE